MTKRDFVLLAAAVLLAIPAISQDSTTTGSDEAQSCSEMHTDFGWRPTARAEQTLSFPASEAPKLTFQENRNSGIRVTGWDKNEYAVLACKSATGTNMEDAKSTLSQIQVQHSGGTLSISGPEREGDRNWA